MGLRSSPGESGFTLLEMMIVLGLMGGMLYFGMSMLEYMGKGEKGVRQSAEYTAMLSQIQMALGTPASCTQSIFGAAAPAIALPLLPVPDSDPFFTTPRKISLLNGVAIADPTGPGNLATGLKITGLHFEPGSLKEVGPKQIIGNLILSVDRFPANIALGQKSFPDRRIPIQLELDGTPSRKIVSCVTGMTEAKISPAACEPGTVLVGYNPANANPAVCEPEAPCQSGDSLTLSPDGHWECATTSDATSTITMCLGGCL